MSACGERAHNGMPTQTLVMNDWLNNVLDRERAETMNGQQLAPIKRTLMMFYWWELILTSLAFIIAALPLWTGFASYSIAIPLVISGWVFVAWHLRSYFLTPSAIETSKEGIAIWRGSGRYFILWSSVRRAEYAWHSWHLHTENGDCTFSTAALRLVDQITICWAFSMYGGIHHFKVDLGDSDDVT